MKNRLYLLPILLAVLMFAAAITPAQATVARVGITGGALLQCTGNVIEGTYTAVAYDASGSVVGSFGATEFYLTTNGGVAPQSATLSSGAARRFYLAIGTGNVVYAEAYVVPTSNPSIRSETVRIYCDGRIEIFGLAAGRTDDRMNYANGDLINVLYPTFDSAGKGGVSVYSLDANSVGLLEGRFAYALFEPYLGNPPAVNTFIARIDYSSLYALTTGEFQIVVDDPLEPKTYTTIFSAFPVGNIYYR